MMPDMEGYEVCRRLRANPATATLPVIMFTAKTTVSDKVAGFQAGADDYLTKPVHPEELASRVEAVLLRSARRQATAQLQMKAKTFGFLGSKGGVGTTMLAVNIAVSMIQGPAKGKKVVLADMRSGMAAAAVQLALRRQGGIARLLEQPLERIDANAVENQLEEHRSGIWVLGGQIEPPGVAAALSPAYAQAIVRQLGTFADYLLLDLGVGLDETNRRLLPDCQYIVMAIEPQRVSLTLGQALLDALSGSLNLPRHRIKLVLINKAPSATTFTKEAIEGLLQHELVGVIPPAPELAFQAVEQGTPMVVIQPTSLVAHQIRTVAEYLVNV